MLLEAARDVVVHDAARAREMAMVAAAIAAFGGDSGVDIDPATFATIPAHASERQRCYAELTLGLCEVVAGDWDAASAMLRRSFATGGQLDLDDLELLPNLGIAALHLGDTLASDDYHQRLLTKARKLGAVVTVLYALTRLAFSDVPNGRWATAVAQQQEALRLGEGTGQPVLAAMPLATLLLLSALRGDDAYDQQLGGVERVLEEQPVGVLDMVLRDVTRWAKGLHAAPAWPRRSTTWPRSATRSSDDPRASTGSKPRCTPTSRRPPACGSTTSRPSRTPRTGVGLRDRGPRPRSARGTGTRTDQHVVRGGPRAPRRLRPLFDRARPSWPTASTCGANAAGSTRGSTCGLRSPPSRTWKRRRGSSGPPRS